MRPKILFIGTSCPFGEISGAGVRTRNVLRLLERIGDVTVVIATGLEWTREQMEATRREFNLEVFSQYRSAKNRDLRSRLGKVLNPRFMNTNGVEVPAADRARVAELVEAHDVVWLHTLKVANAFRRYEWPKSIMDVDDFPSRYHRAAARHAPTLREKVKRLQLTFSWERHERLCLERFGLLTVCKEADRQAFGEPGRVYVVPNGFAAPEEALPKNVVQPNRIGMIGDFNFAPNHDGLRWFIREAWGRIRAQVPKAELRLVGKASQKIAEQFTELNVEGLGYVPDVAQEMASWSCMIVPTRIGGGTHLKVAEGLARRIPIVTSSHGARGYDLTNGKHALIADDGTEFATACIRLLEDPGFAEELRDAGWDHFRARFSWDSIFPSVERVVSECLRRSGGSEPASATTNL